MNEQDLGFIGCEEAARAGMNSMTKDKVIRGSRDKLVSMFLARLLAFLQEAIAVVGGCIGVYFVIFEWLGRDSDVGAFGEHGAVG